MKEIPTHLVCIILILGFLAFTGSVMGQTPQSFSYQAVAHDAAGNALASKTVGLQLSILDGSAAGTVVYSETFSPVTNGQGLFTVAVGAGTVVTGSFSAVNWASGNKYLKTELDPTGGKSYTVTGTSELLSVPYALFAGSTPGGTGGSGPWATSGNNISNSNTGGVGIGTGSNTVDNDLQIGDAPSFSGNYLAMGNGTQATSFAFESGTTTWYTNNNFALMPVFGGAGNVGIGTLSPVNTLQIGNPPGFSGNQLAIGNGTQGTSFALSSTAVTWFSNVPFALMPAGGSGNVGIGVVPSITSTSKMTIAANTNGNGILVQNGARIAFEAASGDLDIDNGDANITGNASIVGSLTVTGSAGLDPLTGAKASLTQPGFIGQAPLAIDASGGDVWAYAFYATSDSRVKNIVGHSDAVSDLEKLDQLEVTDYTMKDTLTFGNRQFKKVIAQQVEKVYPQLIRKQKGFIPNVYQQTTKIQRTDGGYLLTFDHPHHLSAAASRIRVQTAGVVKPYNILSIPSDHSVVIQSPIFAATRVFVYGEEVDDFRSVDYEGLTTLNISATQELSELVKQQAEAIALLKQQVRELKNRIKVRNPSTLENSPLGK
jgi:uncharacterized coiled-coil protein SlyX